MSEEQGMVPYGLGPLPLVLEQQRRFEFDYAKSGVILERLKDVFATKKETIIGAKIAELKNSDERKRIEVIIQEFNNITSIKLVEKNKRVDAMQQEAGKQIVALESKCDHDVKALRASISAINDYIAYCEKTKKQLESKTALLNKRAWSRARNWKKKAEFKQKMEYLDKNKEHSLNQREEPIQEIRDIEFELIRQKKDIRYKVAERIKELESDVKHEIIDEKKEIYEGIKKINVISMEGGMGEAGLFLEINFDAWAISEIKEDLKAIDKEYQAAVDKFTDNLLKVYDKPDEPKPGL